MAEQNTTYITSYTFDMDGSTSSSFASTITTFDYLNSTVNSTMDEFMSCPPPGMPISNVFFMMLYAIVFIIGLTGNTLVIYVVLRFSNMQTVTNMYILNLAIADECFLIGIPFLITTMNMGHWIFGRAMCKAFMVSTSITQFTSSIFLFIMSADRYIAICHHISSPKYRTPVVSRCVSVIAWAASALIMLPIMLYANVMQNDNGHYSCAILWPESAGHIPGLFSFTIYSFLLGFAIPLCFIMTFYCMVIKKLRSVAKKTNRTKGKRRSHRKVTKLVLTVITVYIMCWLPYWIAQVSLISSSNTESCGSRMSITVFLFVGCLGYSNSAINPILYAYLSDNFKKSFLKACTCAATKDVNAQLKLDNSVGLRNVRDHRNSETAPTFTTRTNTKGLNETMTTTTAASNVSSRNPSPPTRERGDGDDCNNGVRSNGDDCNSFTVPFLSQAEYINGTAETGELVHLS